MWQCDLFMLRDILPTTHHTVFDFALLCVELEAAPRLRGEFQGMSIVDQS
jgi:hypothetical protein